MDAGLIQWRSPNSSRYPFFVLTAIWRFVVIQTARQCDSQRESKGYAIAINLKKRLIINKIMTICNQQTVAPEFRADSLIDHLVKPK
jgi:hypothetical protein